MSLINYVLVGLLGAIVAAALYAARWDLSGHGMDWNVLMAMARA